MPDTRTDYHRGRIPSKGKGAGRKQKPNGINAIGYISLQAGLAKACRDNISAFRYHFEVAENDFPPCLESGINAPFAFNYHHWHPDHVGDDLEKICNSPLFTDHRVNVAFWAWEVQGYVKPTWVKASRHFNQVWCPSRYTRDQLAPHLDTEVQAVPHYVHAPRFKRKDRSDRKKGFTILTAFDGKSRLDRKNPAGAIAAFKTAFPRGEDVRLVMKCHGLTPQFEREMNAMIDGDPRIKLLIGYMTDFEVIDLYDSVDCFLSLHKAEGFGLHLAEAMAHSVPVVATGFSGNLDFMNEANSLLVDYRMTDVQDTYYQFGKWADPRVDDAADKLRELWEKFGSTSTKKIIENAYATISSQFSFYNTANTLHALMAKAANVRKFSPGKSKGPQE